MLRFTTWDGYLAPPGDEYTSEGGRDQAAKELRIVRQANPLDLITVEKGRVWCWVFRPGRLAASGILELLEDAECTE